MNVKHPSQRLYGGDAERACDDAIRSAGEHVAQIFRKLLSMQCVSKTISPDKLFLIFSRTPKDAVSEHQGRMPRLRNALDDVNLQLHRHQLQSEVFRRCLAAEESILQQLAAKQNEIVAAMNTIDRERPCQVRLPDEIVLQILSLVHETEGGNGDTTLQKLLRLPDLSDNWRHALRTLTTHSASETFGVYSHAAKGLDGARDMKLYEAMKSSAPAKLDLSFFPCNVVSVRTAQEFSDRWSTLRFRSSCSGPAIVDALTASKEALPNIRRLVVELIEYKERPGGTLLPDSSWKLYSEGGPIRPRLRSARIFLPFLSGLSELLESVTELELLLPAKFTDWDAANRTLASLPALVHLVISPCKIYHKRHVDLFSDEDLQVIASTGPIYLGRLESLQINFDSRIAAAIVAFIRCPSLQQLHLNTSELEFARGRLDSAPSISLLESASEAYPRLETLSIQKSDDHTIKALATTDGHGRWLYPSLTSLDLPTPSPSLISSLLELVRGRIAGQGVAPIRQLKITSPGPSDKNCKMELSSLSLLIPDMITKRKEVNATNSEARVQSYCRVQ